MIDSERSSLSRLSLTRQFKANNHDLEEGNQFMSRGLFKGVPIDFDHPVKKNDLDEEVFKEPTISENMYKMKSELKSSRDLIE